MILFKFFILGISTSLLFPPFFMLPLGFIIFPYFIKLILKISNKKSISTFFNCAFFYALGFLLIFLSWIHNPFLVYESTKPFAFLALLLPIFLSIFFGLFFLIFKFIKDSSFVIILIPLVFILIELLISKFIYGFPWFSYSLILSNSFLGFYILKYFGTFASGFLILSLFCLPVLILNFKIIIKNNKLIIFAYLPFLLGIALPINYYFFSEKKFNKTLSLDIYQIFSPINNLQREKVQNKISKIINDSESDYIIFAENNYPYIINNINNFKLNNYLTNEKKIIIGATREDNGKYYNTFLFFEKNKIQYFDKKILVPFGEFLPLRKYLKFMEKISGGIDYNKGIIDRLLITKDDLKVLPIICYEIIFDKIYKNINKNKIDLLINITNDAWFGNKIGPYQHLYLTRTKALIANKPLVRVSNNGISAIINNKGKIIKFSNLNQADNIKHDLEITYEISYYLFHILFLFYLIFLLLLILLFDFYKKNEKN